MWVTSFLLQPLIQNTNILQFYLLQITVAYQGCWEEIAGERDVKNILLGLLPQQTDGR